MKSAVLLCSFALLAAGIISAAPPTPGAPDQVEQAARKIDLLVAAARQQQKLPPPSFAEDAAFLRRAFLVIIGRIPTVEEARQFLELDDAGKRQLLVDFLLDSPGYTSHLSNWAFDLLRVTDRKIGFQGDLTPYRLWVRRAITDNVPWDRLTMDLIAARGNAWNPDQGAVGYYLRDRGMALDNLANSSRIFLASRLECAQCHDDPYDGPKRLSFYQLAAFTNGQNEALREPMRKTWDEVNEAGERSSVEFQVADFLWNQIYGMSFDVGGSGRIALPDDYQYRNGQPGETVAARTPFGKTVRMSERKDADDGRQKLAEWITGRTGEQFAAVIANRMWKRVMGVGLYEPVDDYQLSQETKFPELISFLRDLMVANKYDLKEFQRILLHTQSFQFAANAEPSVNGGAEDLRGRQLQRLTAEQIWDSLVTLAVGDPDALSTAKLDERIFIGGRAVDLGGKTMADLASQVLAIRTDAEFRRYFKSFVEQVKAARQSGSEPAGPAVPGPLCRASELSSPAPRNHLLYLFGQSDREIVDAASREPNVSQVLALMNGFVQESLIANPQSAIFQELASATNAREKLRRVYLGILGRPPGAEEAEWMLDEVKISGDEAWPNIVSALVMSSEFLFLQ